MDLIEKETFQLSGTGGSTSKVTEEQAGTAYSGKTGTPRRGSQEMRGKGSAQGSVRDPGLILYTVGNWNAATHTFSLPPPHLPQLS